MALPGKANTGHTETSKCVPEVGLTDRDQGEMVEHP